ncbi:MAG: hypothetical protein V4654_04630 [Bdellovibrionota bacterium]
MAKKATASKKATKTVAKPAAKTAVKKPEAKKAALAAKASAKPAAKKVVAKPAAAKAKVDTASKGAKAVVKLAAKVAKAAPAAEVVVKPALMTKKGKAEDVEPKDQGDLLIEKAKEEMANINSAKNAAEKNAKIKPIKIERGNAADEKAKWQELFKRHGKDKANSYKMTDSFDAMKPLQHKVLGWGFILSNENNRLEVLFENGIKMLISNYKPS